MNPDQDYFSLFGIPSDYALDVADLEQRYQDLQIKVHPDKHARSDETERRLAMQWSTRINEAYQTLKNPLARGVYLLKLAGHDPQIEHNTAMPAGFLIEQMELREAVADARQEGAGEVLEEIHARIRREMAQQYKDLQLALDKDRSYGAASDILRRLMFQEKLLHEIGAALEAIEA